MGGVDQLLYQTKRRSSGAAASAPSKISTASPSDVTPPRESVSMEMARRRPVGAVMATPQLSAWM